MSSSFTSSRSCRSADQNVVGAEALIRWRHPLHGIVSPAKFIDIAVETGQIVQVGRFVLDEACRAAALLRATTNSSLWVTFNLALRELRERDIVELVQAALTRHAVRPDALMVEITEAAFLPDERPTTMRLHALKELGLRMAIDDFGTGYSSLSYLTRIPADTVKLARPFIVALDSEGPEATLAQAVVRLCGDLGFSTIGEGIETVRQHERLLELGCPLGPGLPLREADAARDADPRDRVGQAQVRAGRRGGASAAIGVGADRWPERDPGS